MPNVPINITGGSYKSRSRQLSNQKTQNLYPELVDNPSTKSKYVLHGFPGLTLFGTSGSGVDRGMVEFQGILYKVNGTLLYSIASDGTPNVLGAITGTGRCVFEGITNDLIIVSGGLVWVYNSNPDITDIVYISKSFSIHSEESTPTGLTFSSDGTKMYVIGSVGDTIYQYTLSIAWDVETASYSTKSFSVNSEEISPQSLIFGLNGTKVYIVGTDSDTVYQYPLTTAWDISTAGSTEANFSVTSEETFPRELFFSSDGTKMYVVGNTNATVYQYDLTIAWNVGSAGFTGGDIFDTTSQDANPRGLFFNSSGTKMYVLGLVNDTIYQYNLSTAWEVNTATYNSLSLNIVSQVSSAEAISFNSDGTVMYVVGTSNDTVYQYSSTGEVTDADLETPNSVAHLNNQAIYDGDDARWVTSTVGDATDIPSLNYATAESNPDNLLRVYVFNQLLYLMGEKTIETWYNSGVGSPPFDRVEGGIMPIGLVAVYSAAHNDNFLYLLADDNKVYRLFGSTKENVSSTALSHAIEAYTTVSDAIGSTYTFENHNFYELTFPTEGKTWVYPEETAQWFELVSSEGRYIGNSHAYAYRKNLVADYSNGNIYELDIDAFDENGTTVVRIRDTGPIHGELLGSPGKRIEMDRFELIMETGVGLTSGQGSDPVVMLSFSDDGGKTFSTEMWGQAGVQGEYTKVEWFALGSFFERIIRVRLSDPVLWSIHSANADMEAGI